MLRLVENLRRCCFTVGTCQLVEALVVKVAVWWWLCSISAGLR